MGMYTELRKLTRGEEFVGKLLPAQENFPSEWPKIFLLEGKSLVDVIQSQWQLSIRGMYQRFVNESPTFSLLVHQ